MRGDARRNIYERSELQELDSAVIRPGDVLLTDHALSLCSLPAGARLLDIGCGTGGTLRHVTDSHRLNICGIDLSLGMLHTAHGQSPQLTFIRGCGMHLPFRSAVFDAVLFECVLSLMPEPEKGLRETRRVLADNGFLIISDVYDKNSGAGEFILRSMNMQGFTTVCFEDHSRALKEFAARLILQGAGNCLQPLRDHYAECGSQGYFLLVARKGVA
jgi:arsenite methyltransferase